MRGSRAAACLLLVAVCPPAACFEDDDPGTEETFREKVTAEVPAFTDWNFDKLTEATEDPHLLYFHTPWCQVCTNNANAEFEKVFKAKVANPGEWPGPLQFGHIDCSDSPSLCHRLGQRAFPALVMYYPKTKEYVLFIGNRNRDEIEHFTKHTPKEPRKTIEPRPSSLMIMLEYAESMMTTIEIHEDELINSTILGLMLGVILLTPALILYCLAYSALLARDKLKND